MTGPNEERMRDLVVRLGNVNQAVFDGIVEEATRSIVEGSEITGSPGQPVDTGNLRASWHTDRQAVLRALISTNVEYAEPIEEGIGPHGPLTLRSVVGGFGSVRLTVAGLGRIKDAVIARPGGGNA